MTKHLVPLMHDRDLTFLDLQCDLGDWVEKESEDWFASKGEYGKAMVIEGRHRNPEKGWSLHKAS